MIQSVRRIFENHGGHYKQEHGLIGWKAWWGRLIMRLVNTEKLYVINVYHIISRYDMACMFNATMI